MPIIRAVLVCLLVTWASVQLSASESVVRPFLHRLFSDGMVLQRDIKAPVWGWTRPGGKVAVDICGTRTIATAGPDGCWLAKVGPFPAGGPFVMQINGAESVTLRDVLIGDVWLCSGQSNMAYSVGETDAPKEDHPLIRLFSVPKKIAREPQIQLAKGQWDVCTSQNSAYFSAVAYFFGTHLQRELKIPIGLIQSSWPGSLAECWMSAEGLKPMEDFKPILEGLRTMSISDDQPDTGEFAKKLTAWWAKNDPGTSGGWSAPAFNASNWKTMTLPCAWEYAGLPDFSGIVWFRKEVDLPKNAVGKEAMLHLGPIGERDTTWVNGTQVGERWATDDRRDYPVAAKLLKPGRNVIAVRVFAAGGYSGMCGNAEDMSLECPGQPAIPLAGAWQYQDSTPLARLPSVPQRIGKNPFVATVLSNGMIANVAPFGIKGAIWYQGEGNAVRAMQYRRLLPALIADWRTRFGVGNFPFYIVQLPNFGKVEPQPGNPGWAPLREAQALTAATVPNCGLAVTIDVGEGDNLHPKNKFDVGRRLALNALMQTYGRKIEGQGPVFKAMQVEGQYARLSFDHLGGGLVARDLAGKPAEKLLGFAIAGPDGHFVWAEAKIVGDTVVVSNSSVGRPAAVRYAWAGNPVCNLYNQAGLPAMPFRTDTFD